MVSIINDITAFHETKSVQAWTHDRRAIKQLTPRLLRSRLRSGMTPEKAITNPIYSKKYEYNHSYFNEWTMENAWIIGFITADGNISKRQHTLSIDLSDKDRCILEHIRDKVSPQSNLKLLYKSCGTNKRKYTTIRLMIYSRSIVRDLAKYHILPQKTGKERLPDFPNKVIAYRYLLGLIDGDGYIGIGTNTSGYQRNIVALCSSSVRFLSEIREYFNIHNNIHQYTNSKCYSIQIGHKQQLVSLYHNLYDSGGFCLQRKKDIFTEIINSY